MRQSSRSKTATLAGSARAVLDVVWAGVVVCGLAWFALSMAHQGRIAAIWPANAIIVARLLRASPRRWFAYVMAGLTGNVAGDILSGDHLSAALVLSLCNTLEILCCTVVVRRFIGPRPDLSQPRQLAVYAATAALTSLAGASAAALWLAHTAQHPFWRSMGVWALADTLGLMVVAPAVMALNRQGLRLFFERGKALRNLGLVALLMTMIGLVGLQPHHQFSYLIFAALMVIAYKGETTGAAVGLMVTGAAFMAMSSLGFGPGADKTRDPVMEAVLVQLFMLAGAVIVFPIAGAMTRRRELQTAVAGAARDFQMLAENSTDLIVRIDRDLKIVYVSPSCRRLGYQQAEVIGRRVDSLVGPEEQANVQAALEADFRSDAEPEELIEQRLRNKAGEWVWVEGSPKILRGADGRATGLVIQLRDVTARRAAQQALAESEARYRLLAELSTDIIMRMDGEGIVRYISPSCRQLGYDPEALIGRSAFTFLHPDDIEPARVRSDALFSGEPRAPGDGREYRARRKDGSFVWLEGLSALSRDEASGQIDVVTQLRDVTERRAFEDELRRERAEAQAATLAKSEFLANMSHEIRTPLTGIMGFAGLLEAEPDLSPAARTYATRIATGSRTLLTVVNDILDFSKIDAGQVELDPQPFDPAHFVVETVELVSAQAKEKRLELHAAIDGPLPRAVSADAGRLRQVLLNLLTNAIKFTDAGEVTVTVAHDPAADGGRLKIKVSDTGVGIAPDRLHRLFQRFSQADGSISRQYGGTGLGLAICKSLTTLMGGEIGVESTEDRGAVFWFNVKAPACAPQTAAENIGGGEFDARPARILIVDDSSVNRELVSVLLGVFGHTLSEASGGAEAVLAAAKTPFDLILMDLQMPGMDGLAATMAIRAGSPLNRATPIVALSANILPNHLEACRVAGMNDHIGKPIDTRELLTKVVRWTGEPAAEAVENAA